MTGGLLQLVAYGAQDIYLTGNPLVTYFKTIYRRHTNFAIDSVEQTFNSTAGFGREVTCTLSRDGDLIAGAYLQTTLPDLPTSTTNDKHYVRWTDDVGHHLIKYVDLIVSGHRIDRQYGDWLEIWAQLTLTIGEEKGYREMIGQDPSGPLGINTGLQRDRSFNENQNVIPGRTIYVPLQFWFCRNIGLALPLIALQYSEVKVIIKFRQVRELVASFDVDIDSGNTGPLTETFDTLGDLEGTSLWIDYVLLDTDERRRFAQISHEYLIEQVQFNGQVSVSGDTVNTRTIPIDLHFEHPVKELIWVCQYDRAVSNGHVQWSNYTDRSALNFRNVDDKILDLDNLGKISYDIDTNFTSTYATSSQNLQAATSNSYCKPTNSVNPCLSAKLVLNGNQRFSTQPGAFFNLYEPKRKHTRTPRSPGINVYSFAIHPEDHQPSGTCNFSRLHDAKLVLSVHTGTNHNLSLTNDVIASQFRGSLAEVRIYATNYNIFRIMGGLGGLAYRT